MIVWKELYYILKFNNDDLDLVLELETFESTSTDIYLWFKFIFITKKISKFFKVK